MIRRFSFLSAAILVAVPLLAQHGVEGLSNPFNSKQDAAAGGRIFRSHCAVCHGPEGSGGKATDLTLGRFRHGSTDSDLYRTISEGIEGTEMPGTFFNGQQLWQVVAYVRSLSQGRAAEKTTGDPARGRAIFFGKGGCNACHMANGEGARTAPDLSDIGAQRSLAHLEAAVNEPDQQVLPNHWHARAVTKDGEIVQGLRLNEDTHSVQMLDSNERLRSLLKADLKEYEVLKKSTMPSYKGRLSQSEFDDLIAYLASLKI
jgi:putative heme-binding domain-containing protein